MEVSILEAKTNLSAIISSLESGKEDMIIISKYGKPVVKMTKCSASPVSKRIGIAKAKIQSPDDMDLYNNEIAEMFEEST